MQCISSLLNKKFFVASILSPSPFFCGFLSYIFNLEYDRNAKEVCLFFQEFVFGLRSNACKKTSTYMSVTTDIQGFATH